MNRWPEANHASGSQSHLDPGVQALDTDSESQADSMLSVPTQTGTGEAEDRWTPSALREVEDLRAWQQSRGYLNTYRDYGKSSVEDLESLSATGDIGVLQELASRFNMKNLEKSIQYLQTAAIHGSIYALIEAGRLFVFHTRRGKKLVDPMAPEKRLSSALGYFLAARLIGDAVSNQGPNIQTRLNSDQR
ncbi:MAG: hypothetical protein OEM85_05495 [Gammaproteobacteria bacterium]|nr:hypothetical protein [Gammaproteobacteria bacterium]